MNSEQGFACFECRRQGWLWTVVAGLVVCGGGLAVWVGTSAAEESEGAAVVFEESMIRDGYSYSYGLAVADLDHDGDLDITSCDTRNFKLYWFENDGGKFRTHFIEHGDRLGLLGDITGAEIARATPGDAIHSRWFKTPRLERHQIGDLDGDGNLDVVIVENLYGDVYWYRNSGAPARDEVWRRYTLADHTIPGAYDVALVDLDADGDLDVAASTWRLSNKFVWLENPGTTAADQPWACHVIDENIGEPRTIRVADFDADGRPDLLGTAFAANLVVWYRNPGDAVAGPWPRQIIDSRSPQPGHGMPADIDGDGDPDVVMALGLDSHAGQMGTREIVWYENSGKTAAANEWTKHVVGRDVDDAFEAAAVDLDGDGLLDIAATSYAAPRGGLFWFRNPGAGQGGWKRHEIKPDWPRANQVVAADFDGDGRPDLVAGTTGSRAEVRWWRNVVRVKSRP